MEKIKADQTFFTLHFWHENKIERDLIKKFMLLICYSKAL